MPMPTEDRVSLLVAALVEDRGYDLEGVRVTAAGKHSTIEVMVDDDAGVDLDAIAELSNAVSALFDEAGDFGETPYTLEVTTPGVDRPLTLERHWRRARGRRVKLTHGGVETVGRVGALKGDSVDIVVRGKVVRGNATRGKPEPTVRSVPLAEITHAVVEVEFAPPDPRELELTGGVVGGRPTPGTDNNTSIETAGVNEE